MDLRCSAELASAYKSGSQIARVLTEAWCVRELYCPACTSDRLSASKVNTPAIDFVCPECEQFFQLKSLRNWNPHKVVDAGYESMMRSIRADKVPNLLILQYTADWSVRNLLLVPKFFFSESAIEKRRPLGADARRAGWVGCNILLGQIPIDGKIAMISLGLPVPKSQVRESFTRTRSLAKVSPAVRGWAVDVLKIVRRLGKRRFALKDVYEFENELQANHPGNRNVRAKIRQQLQVLRDLGLAEFVGRGEYSLSD